MSEKAFLDLAERVWQHQLKESPSLGLLFGDYRYCDQLEDLSEASEERNIRAIDGFLGELQKINAENLSPKLQVSHGLLGYAMREEQEQAQDKLTEMAVGILGISDMLILYHPQASLPKAEHATMLLKRIELYGRLFTQMIERHRAGIARGRVPTARNIARTANQLEKYLKSPVQHDPLLGVTLPAEMSPEQQSDWRNKGADIITATVRPAIQQYVKFMKDEFEPVGRDDQKCGIMWVKDGEQTYARSLARNIDSDTITAKEVHQYGLDEIKRLASEFETIGGRVFEPGLSFADILKRMAADPRMRYESAEQMIKLAENAIDRAWAKMGDWFGTLPKAPCKVVAVPPEAAEDAPPAFYYPPALDGSRPGTYYTNTHQVTERSLFEAETIAFHEAIPGHHLDRTIATELTDVPQFQRLYSTTAFVEGWGLYSEQLADEMGLFSDDIQQLGRLGNDAWRSCRLVLDTGMHALGWDRDKAMQFFLENSPIEDVNVKVETDRYIAWPGQACAYKMGQRKIMEMRQKAEQALGSRFDIRDFHDEVLKDGGLHLAIFEAKMNRWIGEQAK